MTAFRGEADYRCDYNKQTACKVLPTFVWVISQSRLAILSGIETYPEHTSCFCITGSGI